MGTRTEAGAARLCAPTIDAIILATLREIGEPVEETAIPDECHLRYETTPDERRLSLSRLVERGQIRRGQAKRLNPRHPLLDPVEVVIYQATGGAQ